MDEITSILPGQPTNLARDRPQRLRLVTNAPKVFTQTDINDTLQVQPAKGTVPVLAQQERMGMLHHEPLYTDFDLPEQPWPPVSTKAVDGDKVGSAIGMIIAK